VLTRTAGVVPGADRWRPPSAIGQVHAVLELRLAALRGPDRRRAVRGLAALLSLLVAAPTIGVMLPRGRAGDYLPLATTTWLLFAVAVTLTAATGAGGRQLLTRSQAVAFPVSPAADHLGAVLMAPLNVSWLLQAAGLLTLTAWQLGPSPALPGGLVLTGLWIVAATSAAQTVGWLVELLRTYPTGLAALRGLVASAVLGLVTVTVTGRTLDALGVLPTTIVGDTLATVPWQHPGRWSGQAAALVIGATACWWPGVRLLDAVHRRPPLQQAHAEARAYPRRRHPRSALTAALRVDRAGIRRSTPLRRGLATLVLIPAGVAAAAGLPWPLVCLLPGLVASAAGLLFGVNMFTLDGAGALWRESLPGNPRTYLLSRLLALAETSLGGAALCVLAAGARAPQPPSAAELATVLGATLATCGYAVGRCADWSVHRPYAAGLREARDQPAPPGAMAGYAARLAMGTTLLGIVFVWLAGIGSVQATLLITTGALLVVARRLIVVARQWQDPDVRSRVLCVIVGE
jgi:hypothetical protein